jgi:hypothetical protein
MRASLLPDYILGHPECEPKRHGISFLYLKEKKVPNLIEAQKCATKLDFSTSRFKSIDMQARELTVD